MQQVVDTLWSDTWQPSDAALAWAIGTLRLLRDGGTLLVPGSQHIYKVSHTCKTLTLLVGDPMDEMAWHRKNVVTFKRIGYTVLDQTPATAARN